MLSVVYTAILKISKIIPVLKTDNETNPSVHRSISLLSNFNRIFEKLIYKRMNGFIGQHAVIDIVNSIQRNIDKRLFTCGVFIDFNTVDHAVLLDKLNYYGFHGVINKWFSWYLNDRTQTTQIDPRVTKRSPMTCVFPQAPFFLLYINDVYTCSGNVQFYLFTDDTNILYSDNLKSLEGIFLFVS